MISRKEVAIKCEAKRSGVESSASRSAVTGARSSNLLGGQYWSNDPTQCPIDHKNRAKSYAARGRKRDQNGHFFYLAPSSELISEKIFKIFKSLRGIGDRSSQFGNFSRFFGKKSRRSFWRLPPAFQPFPCKIWRSSFDRLSSWLQMAASGSSSTKMAYTMRIPKYVRNFCIFYGLGGDSPQFLFVGRNNNTQNTTKKPTPNKQKAMEICWNALKLIF